MNMVPAPDSKPPRGTGGGEAETERGGAVWRKPCDRAGALRVERRIRQPDSTPEAAREQRMRGSSVFVLVFFSPSPRPRLTYFLPRKGSASEVKGVRLFGFFRRPPEPWERSGDGAWEEWV